MRNKRKINWDMVEREALTAIRAEWPVDKLRLMAIEGHETAASGDALVGIRNRLREDPLPWRLRYGSTKRFADPHDAMEQPEWSNQENQLDYAPRPYFKNGFGKTSKVE
jgi:hypothetical protein